MSINIGKVKSVLAGEKHQVSFEEHKYILQCFLKMIHDEGETPEKKQKVAVQLLDYTIDIAGSEDAKATPEVLLSIAAVKTCMRLKETYLKYYLHKQESWYKWSQVFLSIVRQGENLDQLVSPVTGPEGLLEFRDVELPA